MTTETEFPVETGTTITVLCQDGWINTGSKTITCNTYKYGDFVYDSEPTCGRAYGKDGKFISHELASATGAEIERVRHRHNFGTFYARRNNKFFFHAPRDMIPF